MVYLRLSRLEHPPITELRALCSRQLQLRIEVQVQEEVAIPMTTVLPILLDQLLQAMVNKNGEIVVEAMLTGKQTELREKEGRMMQ